MFVLCLILATAFVVVCVCVVCCVVFACVVCCVLCVVCCVSVVNDMVKVATIFTWSIGSVRHVTCVCCGVCVSTDFLRKTVYIKHH